MIPCVELTTLLAVACQCINADGAKQSFGPLRGHGMVLGNPMDHTAPLFVVEGWADAVGVFSVYQGHCCSVAALGKGQMLSATELVGAAYGRPATILEDRDG